MANSSSNIPMHAIPVYSILLFLSYSLSSVHHLCASNNHISPGEHLLPGNTLVSDDGTFALGFFSPSNTTRKHYYIGIWYNNIPQCTVVWVANRAAPITDLSSATLAMTRSSNLVLYDGNGRVIWMTNNTNIGMASSSSSSTTASAKAVLDNTGNFILRSSDNSSTAILWQSFDYPTDTLLPGMNLRISHKMHPVQHIISWKGPRDPSPGAFSYGADPNNFLQRFTWNGTRQYRRSPVWSSYILLGGYMDKLHSSIYMEMHRGSDDELYMSFGIPVDDSSSPLIRMELKYSGVVSMLSWDSNMSVWTALYTEPAHECNKYAYCGPYSYCDNTETAPTCKCLDGFEVEDDEGWRVGRNRFWQGCHRKKTPRCSGGDGFLTLPGMKVPDQFLYVQNKSFDECMAECRSNCSCVAYAYANMSTRAIDGDGTRCLIWIGTLIDMEKSRQGGENLYIRVNKFGGIMSKANTLKIVLPVVSSLLGTLGDEEIAVKRLCVDSGLGAMEFKNKVILIAKLQHRNLVKMLGYCVDGDEKLLVYEYLPNKSLGTFLFDAARKSLLDWHTRFEIIKGIARGLLYLHQDSRSTIIHRDLKADNILLDAEKRPKIADFDTARIFDPNEKQSNTIRVVGTL
ncbi:hypothetical protein EJB05_09372 [Eragrostis curvula]|uniref:non-specific serine/threonine protein kinase n=1 Tax=Eragrostis curvula TaxID=38414 RepID=A0A5J9W4T7_9POAL|nr:hypothetical protein EJB05_09372 [Eragrostis curvula]